MNDRSKPVLPMRDGRLRPATGDDLDALVSLLHQQSVRRLLCDDTKLPRQTVADMLEHSQHLDRQGLGLWVIEPEKDVFAGIIGLQPVSAEASVSDAMVNQIEPTIALDQRFGKKGLARDALNTIIEYARTTLALDELVAAVDRPNTQSHRLMSRVGFKAIGSAPGPAHELVLYQLSLNGGA